MKDLKKCHDLSGHVLYRDVVHYSNLGEHRTATPADLKTSQWVQQELKAAGYHSEYLSWNLRQFFIEQCWVEVYGTRINAFPLWYPKATGPVPVQGSLALITNDADISAAHGKIALVQFDEMVTPDSHHAAHINQLSDAGALAIIGYFPCDPGEIYGHNVIPPFNQQAWPIPVATIAANDWHILTHAACQGDDVGLLIDGRDEPQATANNVIARLERADKWIIVSTPQSGWFRSAGERGTGLALFLGLARWASQQPEGPSFLFLTNSGHEIGHMGMKSTLEHVELPSPEKTLCWLHLGSSIATRQWAKNDQVLQAQGFEKESWLLGSAGLIPLLTESFQPLKHIHPQIYNLKRGEIRWILEQGYPAFALMGPHRYFHLPGDGPEVTSPDLLELVGQALTQTLHTLSQTPNPYA